MTIMSLPKVTRDDVLEFLKRYNYDEHCLNDPMASFDGLTAAEFAYRVGWRPVLIIMKRLFDGC